MPTFICPNCEWRASPKRQIIIGAKIRCSHCQTVFTYTPVLGVGDSLVMPSRSSNYSLSTPATHWDTESWYKPSFFNENIGERIANPQKRSERRLFCDALWS